MGHRANFAVVEHGVATVFYDHWAGCDLSDHLVLGPEHTLRWVRQQEPVGDQPNGGWLDEVWACGGLTVDLDRRRLVWFDLPTQDHPRRRVILDVLARTWPGWNVRHTARGLGDIAEAAGVPRARVGDLGFGVCPHPKSDDTDAAPVGMSAAVTEFLDEFTRVHAADAVHPAIQAMDALESLLGLPAGLLNPAIADHHPLSATADEVAVVVGYATQLRSLYLAAESGAAPARGSDP
jgi:hypothetical protein